MRQSKGLRAVTMIPSQALLSTYLLSKPEEPSAPGNTWLMPVNKAADG